MTHSFKNWKDFNNISIRVSLKRKIFDAIFIVDNNRLILKINMIKDINEWRKTNKNYDILSGKFLFNNEKVFLINCMHSGHSSTTNCKTGKLESAFAEFIIDRIIIDKNLSQKSLNNINKYSSSYENLDFFIESKPFMSNLKTFDYDSNTKNYKIKTDTYLINIMTFCSLNETQQSLSINRLSQIDFSHKKGISIKKVLENIYTFRNFLMLILKHPIYVKKKTIYIDDHPVELFDCSYRDTVLETTDIEEMLSHRCLKIDNIDNIELIYNNFINKYNQLYPLIELYYNVTQYKVPNLTRFINSTTMLENYSRNYDFESAFALTKSKDSKSKDANYIDMIISLITNVNDVFNYTTSEIDTIAKNIKSARIYYIHYKTKQKSKPLTYDEQFHYSYFIEDIVLINIYKLIGLDITKYEYISFNQFYYDKYDLI